MAQRELRTHADTGHGPALRAVQCLAFLVGMGVCLALSLIFAIQSIGCIPRTHPPAAQGCVFSGERINPNEAPVPSLMRLPQIGVARARAIVAHRDRVQSQAGRPPAFQTADDLQNIKGIGPVIVDGLRPWLQFESRSPDGREPATDG